MKQDGFSPTFLNDYSMVPLMAKFRTLCPWEVELLKTQIGSLLILVHINDYPKVSHLFKFNINVEYITLSIRYTDGPVNMISEKYFL